MEQEPDSLGPDLLRQRRNLLLVSLALILFDIGGVRVEEVSILGSKLLFARAGVIRWSAWLLWFYFLLRFYQFNSVVPDRGIATATRARMLLLAQRHAGVEPRIDAQGRAHNYSVISGGFLRWGLASDVYNIDTSSMLKSSELFGFWRGIWWLVCASIYVTTKTPLVTNFVLPYIVGAAAPIVATGYLIVGRT
jgi:hypothetical protein